MQRGPDTIYTALSYKTPIRSLETEGRPRPLPSPTSSKAVRVSPPLKEPRGPHVRLSDLLCGGYPKSVLRRGCILTPWKSVCQPRPKALSHTVGPQTLQNFQLVVLETPRVPTNHFIDPFHKASGTCFFLKARSCHSPAFSQALMPALKQISSGERPGLCSESLAMARHRMDEVITNNFGNASGEPA